MSLAKSVFNELKNRIFLDDMDYANDWMLDKLNKNCAKLTHDMTGIETYIFSDSSKIRHYPRINRFAVEV